MFELEKTFKFEAAHSLSHHDGKCKGLHGHSYILKVKVSSETLVESGPKTNMVMDFDDLSKLVKPLLVKYFDHRYLNDTLDCDSPTAEFIAKWTYDFLEPELPALQSITIQETTTSQVTYTRK
ncbi:MAG: 6-pyruvoyltetrahydropterin/6-carboxytetrahydropterin synthase [Chlamydiales bacterium]|jgi:6-pyruvoyltetrahydropterin/6-carboxytetrahydropterin synthase